MKQCPILLCDCRFSVPSLRLGFFAIVAVNSSKVAGSWCFGPCRWPKQLNQMVDRETPIGEPLCAFVHFWPMGEYRRFWHISLP